MILLNKKFNCVTRLVCFWPCDRSIFNNMVVNGIGDSNSISSNRSNVSKFGFVRIYLIIFFFQHFWLKSAESHHQPTKIRSTNKRKRRDRLIVLSRELEPNERAHVQYYYYYYYYNIIIVIIIPRVVVVVVRWLSPTAAVR